MKLESTFRTGTNTRTTTHATGRVSTPSRASKRITEASPAARNLAMAHHLDHLIERGLIADFTAAARVLGVSQPRLTHLMSLLLLAPSIQEEILLGTRVFRDKQLRGLARVAEWEAQQNQAR